MKRKDSPTCNFCNQIDDIDHCFFNCPMVHHSGGRFSTGGIVWVTSCLDFNQSVNVKHILFEFNHETDAHLVLDYCVMYTKFYIYKHRLHRENELDIHGLQSYLKWKIKIEQQICTNKEIPKRLINL